MQIIYIWTTKTAGTVENPTSQQITLGGIQIQSSTIGTANIFTTYRYAWKFWFNLDVDLWKSLKAKRWGAIGLPIYGILLMFN